MKLCLGTILAGVALCATADTLTWKATTGGNWSSAANWSSDGSHTVPQSGDTIKILNLASGQTYVNDIEGLSTPHLEFGGATASPYPVVSGKAITLTGGWNAAKAASGRFDVTLPLVLTVQNGNPTNRFDNPGRWQQAGKVSGPGLLYKDGNGIMEIKGGNTYTGGTVNGGVTGGWLDPYTIASGENAGATPMGTGSYEMRSTGLSRFSNPASVDVHIEPPANKSATAGDLLFYSGTTKFSGTITGTRFVVLADSNVKTVFEGDVTIPDGPVRFNFQSPGTKSTISPTIAGRLACATLNDRLNLPTAEINASLTLSNTDNEIGAIYANYWNLTAGAKGAFGRGAVVYPGRAQDGRGTLDLNGFDQTIDRFAADSAYPDPATVGRVVTSETPACLTMAATADSVTDARFDGALTLVWNPASQSGFSTHPDATRAHGMTGRLVVSNGIFSVTGGSTFSHATGIEVADGARFLWQSSGQLGLAAVQTLKIGAGATFTVASDAALPFTQRDRYAYLSLDLDATARFELPAGTEIPVSGISTNGVALPVPAVFCGDAADADAIYLPQLAGTGVRLRTVRAVPTEDIPVSSRAYVQDGLVLQLDGLENAGRGVHDASATSWTDLTGLYDPNGDSDFAVTTGVGSFTDSGLKKLKSGVLAVNPTRRDDVRTIEAAVSSIADAGSVSIMPVFISQYQNIVFKDANGVRRLSFDYNHYGLDTASCPDPVTVCALFDQRTSATACYQDGVATEGTPINTENWSDSNNPKGTTTLGGRTINWAGNDTNPYGYTINAVRLYSRKLMEEEVRLNAALDALRFRGVMPTGLADYRASDEFADNLECRIKVQVVGGEVVFGNVIETCEGGAWAGLGDRVTVTLAVDSAHRFVRWEGDMDAVVDGDATRSTITLRVDRALMLRAVMEAGPFTVVCDTNLVADVGCNGILFMGPYTVTAAEGVTLTVEEGGTGIAFAEGVTGTAAIACPLAIGPNYGGPEQTIAVPASTTLEIRNGLSGRAALSIPGPGDLKIAGGAGAYAGNIDIAAGRLTVSGTFLDAASELVLHDAGRLTLAGADVGGLVRNSVSANTTWLSVANGTENELRSGFVCTYQQGQIDTGDASSILRIARNMANGNGFYVTSNGSGTIHISDIVYMDTMMGAYQPGASTKTHLWCAGALKVGNHLSASGKLYSHAANTLGHSPLRLYNNALWDLGGFDQTCGRFSWMDDYPNAEIRSDAPATLRVYQDIQSGSGSNRGMVTWRGRITGFVSLVKTGNETSTSTATTGASGRLAEDLIIGSAISATGEVSTVWGLLSFTNSADRVGSWLGCTKATAGRTVDARGEAHCGVLELQHSKVFGKETDVYVAKGAKVRLPAGVSQRVRNLYFENDDGEWVKQAAGVWGSTASGAAHRSDTAFEGVGTLRALGEIQPTILIFR